MKFAVLIQGAPYSTQAAYSALNFCKAVLSEGHEIYRVFLYQDAVHLSTSLATPPQDEFNIYAAWTDLAREHNIDMVTCIAAAARRGLIDEREAKRHNKTHFNLAADAELSGLGQWIDAMIHADRSISFGG